MKNMGRIFGDTDVRGKYCKMYAEKEWLTIIRTYSLERIHIARIPLKNGSADMDNISYGLESLEGAYYDSGYYPNSFSFGLSYIYGNGSYFQSNAKNGTALESDISVYKAITDGENIFYFPTYPGTTYDECWIVGVLNDNSDVIEINLIDTSTANECATSACKEQYPAARDMSTHIYNSEYANNYYPISKNKIQFVSYAKTTYSIISAGTYTEASDLLVTLNLDDFSYEVEILNSTKAAYFHYYKSYSYHIGNGYQTHIAYKGGDSLAYGVTDEEFYNTKVVSNAYLSGSAPSSTWNDTCITSLALSDNKLIMGAVFYSYYGELRKFIIIDTETNTGKYASVDIKAYISEEE